MDLEKRAIERIRTGSELSLHHYGLPLVCTYSGGKDSDVLLELFRRSGVPYEVHHSHTTVDAPPTVYHIQEKFRKAEAGGVKCRVEMPYYKGKRIDMWGLISAKGMPPTRIARYCCQVLKETGCKNRFIASGVRWDESNARSSRGAYEKIGKTKCDRITATDETMLLTDNSIHRQMIESCQRKNKMVVNPIIDWTNSDIWDYIRSERIQYNSMYDQGYYRVGCVGCPVASKGRWKEFADYPTYQAAYIRAFDKMLNSLKANCKNKGFRPPQWQTGLEVFYWWMEDQNIKGQLSFDMDGYIQTGQ